MKKQLQIGFAVVVILLTLESARALAGTLDQIEIRIVTQDGSSEVIDGVMDTPERVSMEPVLPTVELQPSETQPPTSKSSPLNSFPAQNSPAISLQSILSTETPSPTATPTATKDRLEVTPTSTPRITFTPVPTDQPVWKKYVPPSEGGTNGNSSGSPESAPTEIRDPMPTGAPSSAPLPTSAPPASPDGAPTEGGNNLPTSAPPPAGP